MVNKNADGVIEALRRAAAANPHLRIGQIIASANYEARKTVDPFNISDHALMVELDRMARLSREGA